LPILKKSAEFFPYGKSDFAELRKKGRFFCDNTEAIRTIESLGDVLLFRRPPRWGKSLLLSMLGCYYDELLKDDFGKLFGGLNIGKNPTGEQNTHQVLFEPARRP
jgi:hypothetical protein